MPLTGEYSQKVHEAYQVIQKKGGMTNQNLKKLQKLLKYYPENRELEVDGLYGRQTIKAIEGFYKDNYWNTQRVLDALIEKHGEKAIMQSELEGMKADSTKY